MRRNVANQTISAEVVYANGVAFTGNVTCYVTKDGGNQTLGSVGSGLCTHKGNGEQEYKPAQAETDADYIKFTFTGNGAVPVGIPLYTRYGTDVEAIDGSTDAADTLQRGVDGTGKGTVGNGSTTVSVVSSAMSPAGAKADQFKGRILTFDKNTTTAALRGQATTIQSSSNASTPTFGVVALTDTPVSGDTFTVT